MAWRDAGITARLTRIEVSLEGLVRRVEKSLGDSRPGEVGLVESGLDGERESPALLPVQQQIDNLFRLAMDHGRFLAELSERVDLLTGEVGRLEQQSPRSRLAKMEDRITKIERKIDSFHQVVTSLQATVTDKVAPLLSEVWGARHELGWYRQVAGNRPVVRDAEGRTWVQEGGPAYPGPALPSGETPPAEGG
jgi:hypothetical protein